MSRRQTLDLVANGAVLIGAAIGVFGVILSWSVNLLILSIIILGFSGIIIKYGDWILPSLLSVTGRHPVYETLEILEDAILMKEGGTWTAVGYIILEVYFSPLDEADKDKQVYFTMLASLFSHLPSRCIISQYISPVDVSEVRRKMKRELNLFSADLAGATQDRNSVKERELKQKIKELEYQFDALDRDRPIDVSFFTKLSATADSREEAHKKMRLRRGSMESHIRGVMRVNSHVATGRDLIDIVRVDMTIPKRELV